MRMLLVSDGENFAPHPPAYQTIWGSATIGYTVSGDGDTT